MWPNGGEGLYMLFGSRVHKIVIDLQHKVLENTTDNDRNKWNSEYKDKCLRDGVPKMY